MTTTTRDAALEAVGLGKRYRRGWALRDCTFELPTGRVSALVGPNGAGKSTLMALSTGLLRPTSGVIRVLGKEPGGGGTHQELAFLAQDKPLYRRFTVDEVLRAGQALNPGWDHAYAHRLVREAGVNLDARVGTLSGGQRTRVALAVALGRRPQLLMLDEPLADLDPLAREEVMQTVMAEVAETGMTVLLSSHVLADMEGVCDHLILLAAGRVHLVGDVEDLIADHRLMIGPRRPAGHGLRPESVVEARATGRQETVLVRDGGWHGATGWELHEPTLEELAMAYLRSASPQRPARTRQETVA
ncbi:ABC-2 type transport system ATP-binding protein [Micromonospora pattaloongensis]|uniref:ABC-2 type transport system ATP-binding protein n=1 Tax=Micromonospora pattaloongensis TaxID=405436 RepID=A0A1H3NWC3_9ACTN|nr:ABC transporter ATP-binding protein [Micromonospora pattaloongensis]SDY93161.1 ABC-2 type transport system ATP-binding protein [Micromonospora pattaloongensis]